MKPEIFFQTANTTLKNKLPNNSKLIIIGVVLLISALFIIWGNKDSEITLNNYYMNISGMYGTQIKYNDILEIDTLAWIPKIEYKSKGYNFASIRKGHFNIQGIGEALVFADCGVRPIIKIKLRNNAFYFINFKKSQSTINLYKSLIMKINK